MSDGRAEVPNLLLIGAMKAGTTAMAADFRSSPGFFVPVEKEPNCLSAPDDQQALSAYASHYTGATAPYLLDCSTYYSKLPDWPGVPQRAKSLLGSELRIVYMTRDPFARAVSQFRHEAAVGKMSASLSENLRSRTGKLRNYSNYEMQLSPWLDTFSPTQIYVGSFEEYVSAPAAVLTEIQEQLQLSETPRVAERKNLNAAQGRLRSDSPLSRLVNSEFYRSVVRPRIPDRARAGLRTKLAEKLANPVELECTVAPDMVDELLNEFADTQRFVVEELGLPSETWDFEIKIKESVG